MRRGRYVFIVVQSFFMYAPPVDVAEGRDSSVVDRSSKDTALRRKMDRQRERIQSSKIVHQEVDHSGAIELKPHEHQVNGRSEFEQAIKVAFEARKANPNLDHSESLKEARRVWAKSRKSYVPMDDFVMHLRDRWNNNDLHQIYSGRSLTEARSQMEADLKTINPFLYKKFKDSFFDKTIYEKKAQKSDVVRVDDEYFDWLSENPDYLWESHVVHGKTPLEIAVTGENSYMAEKIIEIAHRDSIGMPRLVMPLVDAYKAIYQRDGESAAHKYVQKIYKLDVPELSNSVHEEILKLQS